MYLCLSGSNPSELFVVIEQCRGSLVVQEGKVCQGRCEAHLDAKPAQYSTRLALHFA